ncbi:restriction endonuclease subunit S [uncultured Fusobacterium sp.]|uniref:restriction endonuclease subunit S n=1 Tax=uncultured Fusobacterium sp. TaxID=159267 RepID=UPI0025F320C4|nr:restriction endonuclease subunit S [uncultured Fusobacterium sp.]
MKIYSEELKKIKLIDVFEIVLSGEWGEENLEDNENTAYIIRTTNFLNNGTLDIENRELVKRQISSEKINEKCLKRGDIIIEKSGGSPNQPVGRVVYFDIESEKNFLCNNFTSVLRVKEGIEPKYIFYFLKDCYKKRIILKYQNKTTGIINLKLQDYLKNTEIQLPNIEIQNKIVEILDKAFLINSLLIEKERRISELNKCLFIKMFGDPILNEKKWEKKYYEDISILITDGEHQTPKRSQTGIYLLSARNIHNYCLKLEDVDYIDEEEYTKISKRIIPKENDILISCSGSIGRVCLIPKNLKLQLVRSVALIRLKENMNPVFMEYLITSEFTQRQIKKEATKSSQANLFQGKIKKLIGIVPPIELQNQFAERVKMIEKSKFEIQKSIEETQKLFDSLMEKYFG